MSKKEELETLVRQIVREELGKEKRKAEVPNKVMLYKVTESKRPLKHRGYFLDTETIHEVDLKDFKKAGWVESPEDAVLAFEASKG